MKRQIIFLALAATLSLYLTAPVQAAQDAEPPALRLNTPSGLPVPRFVSLKAEKTFCRTGPSFAHPVRITFMRKGLPVMVVAETNDHWRKVRDLEGDECWTHKSKLSGVKTALVLNDRLPLHKRPDDDAPVIAHLGRGLIARIEASHDGWLRISAKGVKGWAAQSAFWGAHPGTSNIAPQN